MFMEGLGGSAEIRPANPVFEIHVAAGRGPRCCNILKALRQSPVAQPPLPNLQRLDYRCYVSKDYHLLDIFFVPSLIDLTIEVHPASFPDVSFISPLAIFPSFRLNLPRTHHGHCVKCRYEPSSSSDAPLRSIQPSSDHFRRMAPIPSLTELDISIPSGLPYNLPQFPHPTLPRLPPFSQIKSFGMNSVRLTTISAFIKAIQSSSSHLRLRQARRRHLKI
ncbi:uncharacterized protein HD556DRAFT_1528290 [Suillus plorans]|uniref:Uncharacterized protein n=1 Tax=Suillus plorans TaxID=116603 RepID=A0A9P7AL67_9AGAM|nr:uncharacterized protein HD556DRAFT_1528290 [Suillus plorans]KAG1791660.1 hypothetical protein HD556DRAFT_1528290 [Suillus plorans]